MATKYGVEAFIEWAKIKGRTQGAKRTFFAIAAIIIIYLVLNEYVFVGTLES